MNRPSVEIEEPLQSDSRDVVEAIAWSAAEQSQLEHYNRISLEYDAHYNDPDSLEYRRRFIYGPMFEGLALQGMKVLDAMCGSGQTTDYLMSQGANVTGLDLSHEQVARFRYRRPTCEAVRRSILDSEFADDTFDCVAIVGGLHHMHPHLNEAVREVHRILKPGGYFCFMEPHSGSLANLIRVVWYKLDHFFADNEAAVDLRSLEAQFQTQFRFHRTSYLGNIAFLLVLNSLIFRIPLGLKARYAPSLMWLEAKLNRFQGKLNSCFAVAQWEKKASGSEPSRLI